MQLARALEEDRAATSDPGGQKADAACLLPHSTPTLPPGSDHLITHPSLGWEAPIPHWLWQNRHCTGSWGRKGRREKNFGLAAPNQSCNLYDRGAQTLYPPSPSSPAFPPQRGNLESTLCKVWVRSATAEFWQLPFANVFVRSNIQNQVGKRPRGKLRGWRRGLMSGRGLYQEWASGLTSLFAPQRLLLRLHSASWSTICL